MEQFIAITKKYGVTGVLAMWLWHTDNRLNKVETALYDCYKTQAIVKKTASTSFASVSQMYAVLPSKTKIKTKYGYVIV
jgi:hypothetical protein